MTRPGSKYWLCELMMLQTSTLGTAESYLLKDSGGLVAGLADSGQDLQLIIGANTLCLTMTPIPPLSLLSILVVDTALIWNALIECDAVSINTAACQSPIDARTRCECAFVHDASGMDDL